MNLYELASLYKVDRRVLYMIAKAEQWGAYKKNGAWYFNHPPLDDHTLSVKVIAEAIGCSREIVRRWCRESALAMQSGRPAKLRAVQVGRTWRIHFEDGARLIMAQLGGFRRREKSNG